MTILKMSSLSGLLAAASLAAAAAVSTGPAFAGADDGGTKLFYSTPGPGAYSYGPAATTSGTSAGQSQFAVPNSPATATVSDPAYEQYRTVQPAGHRMTRHMRHRATR